MKKLVLMLVVLVGVSTTNFTIASDNNQSKVNVELSPLDNLQFKLVLDQVNTKSTVLIKDYSGAIIYTVTVPKTEKYTKIFDLSNLRDGSYVFQINNGKERVEKQFEINTEVKRIATQVTE